MHPETIKARRVYRDVAVQLGQARQRLIAAQREFDNAETCFRTAQADFATHLEIDGSSFDEWQRNRDAFGAILSALPQ